MSGETKGWSSLGIISVDMLDFKINDAWLWHSTGSCFHFCLKCIYTFYDIQIGVWDVICMNFIQNMLGKFKKEMHSCESWSEQNSTHNYMKRLFFGALMH